MTIKERYFYRDTGDHIAFRDASVHVIDNRDKRGLDGRRLYIDEHPQFVGAEPPWVAPGHFLKQEPIECLSDEVEFDHVLTEDELQKEFPNYSKYQLLARRLKAKRDAATAAAEQAQKDEIAAELKAIEEGR